MYLNKAAILLIKLYKYFFSPYLGRNCRFYPSCSEYALICFQKKRFIIAWALVLVRLCKCNPLFEGGIDHLPDDSVKKK